MIDLRQGEHRAGARSTRIDDVGNQLVILQRGDPVVLAVDRQHRAGRLLPGARQVQFLQFVKELHAARGDVVFAQHQAIRLLAQLRPAPPHVAQRLLLDQDHRAFLGLPQHVLADLGWRLAGQRRLAPRVFELVFEPGARQRAVDDAAAHAAVAGQVGRHQPAHRVAEQVDPGRVHLGHRGQRIHRRAIAVELLGKADLMARRPLAVAEPRLVHAQRDEALPGQRMHDPGVGGVGPVGPVDGVAGDALEVQQGRMAAGACPHGPVGHGDDAAQPVALRCLDAAVAHRAARHLFTPVGERETQRDRCALAQHVDRDRLSDAQLAQQRPQRLRPGDRPSGDGDQRVAGQNAGRRCSASGRNRAHHHTVGAIGVEPNAQRSGAAGQRSRRLRGGGRGGRWLPRSGPAWNLLSEQG